MKSALVIIDMQNDYFPGGSMELHGINDAAQNAGKLLDFFRSHGKPVIHIQHISIRKESTFFNPGTPGIEINDRLKPLETEMIVKKHYPNSFRGTELLKTLSDEFVTDIVFCGAMSNMCVDATVRAGFDLGYKCIVATDACAARSLTFNGQEIPAEMVHGAFMASLGAVYAGLRTSGEIIDREGQEMKEKP